ncbi:MAG: ribonuclease H-like YkuK family protein [Candidatus Portnoybacteria bacterium]|nr:ribonuclease H-like YkuK family protein [Candidatus Portnoybacteria bacterium]
MSESFIFFSPSRGALNFEGVMKEIADYLCEDSKRNYKIIIGTDSQLQGNIADFVTAIVIHRIGRGGRYFWQKTTKGHFFSLRQRIYEEVNYSLSMAQKVVNSLNNYLADKSLLDRGLEIHVDVGENGETRELVREVVNIVRGNGFHVKTKPESFGASKVADKHT